jgi:hypothetical protein
MVESIANLPQKKMQVFSGYSAERIEHADNRFTLAEAKAALLRMKKELSLQNESAVHRLEEGFEETVCLLSTVIENGPFVCGVNPIRWTGRVRELGISLKTTNNIESLYSLMAARTDKVDHWENSNQR